MKTSSFYSKYRFDLIVVTIYIILTTLLTYPVAFHLTSRIAGFPGEDNLQWRWFLWWFKQALLNLHTSVTNISILYAPAGGEQPLYAITSFVPALALPVTLLGGPTLSFNLSFLLSFVLSGYSTYLLAYYLTRQRLSAFVAGLIFAFYPARFGYATGTFLGQLTTYFLPLYLLGLFMLTQHPHRTVDSRLLRRAIWVGLVLACLCLTWPLHVMYGAVVFTIAFLIFQIHTWLRSKSVEGKIRQTIQHLAMAFFLTFVLVIGPYLPLLTSVQRGDNKHLGDTKTTEFALDLLAFITPSNYHPILQPLGLLPAYTSRVLSDYNDIQERLAYIGVVPMLLVGLSLIQIRTRQLFWLLTALVTMTLSLGPLLKFNGSLVKIDTEGYLGYIVLPYALLRTLPILDWSGVLGRLNVATMLAVAVMSAYGISGLGSIVKLAQSNKIKYGLVSILSFLILFEFLTIFPFPTESDNVPVFYYQLKQMAETTPQRVINLPLSGNPFYNNYAMHYQTIHQQPIAGGHFMRKPAGAQEISAFIQQLLSPPPPQSALKLPDSQARLGLLNQFGFTKVIVSQWLMQDEAAQAQLAYLSTWLDTSSEKESGDISVFEPQPGGFPLKITSLLDGDGWQPGENSTQLQAPADMLVYVSGDQIQEATLQLSLASPNPDRYLSVDLDGRPLFRLYLRSELLIYHLPLSLSPGIHRFTFYPQEDCQQACTPVNFTQIILEPRSLEEKVSHPPHVIFDDQLTLIAYEISVATAKPGQPILIYLYWQGRKQLNVNYSAFIHLISPSQQIIGQNDYLLGSWAYPTSRWTNDYITAVPSLFFVPTDALPGQYQLQIGIYGVETGQRLRVTNTPKDQDSTVLATIIVTQ